VDGDPAERLISARYLQHGDMRSDSEVTRDVFFGAHDLGDAERSQSANEWQTTGRPPAGLFGGPAVVSGASALVNPWFATSPAFCGPRSAARRRAAGPAPV
jgi:hypothetical protein